MLSIPFITIQRLIVNAVSFQLQVQLSRAPWLSHRRVSVSEKKKKFKTFAGLLILITVHNNHQLISAGHDQGRTDVLFILFTTTSFGVCFPNILINSNKFFGVNVFLNLY